MRPRDKVPDRWAWAEAVVEEKLQWVFAGIDRPSQRNPRGRESKYTYLGWLLVSSERFMNDWMEDCAKAYFESEYDDEWREYCEHKLHRTGCCPNDPEEKATFDEEVQEMFENRDARWTWAHDRCDPSWEWECINDCTKDVWWVAHFLKEHPVVGVLYGDCDVADIDDIVRFCEHCNQPITNAHQEEDGEYTYTICDGCGEHEGYSKDDPQCPQEPPNLWPPGAPWPPRRHLDGTPLYAPPTDYEEYMDATRQG